METEPTAVLLVGETVTNSLQLLQWLTKRGCLCETAASYREACTLLSRSEYDPMIRQYQLPDRTAFPFLDWLVGSATTLVFSTTIETGSLWLLMLERGERCVRTPILRSSDFVEVVERLLDSRRSFAQYPVEVAVAMARTHGGNRPDQQRWRSSAPGSVEHQLHSAGNELRNS